MSTTYVTPKELAEELNVSINTLSDWRATGRGPSYVKVEGSVRYNRDKVNSWLESRTIRTKGKQ